MFSNTLKVSRWKVAIATVAFGALLVVPAAAQDDQSVGFEITGGSLTEALTEDTAMSGVTYSPASSGTSTGTLNASVTDERGTETGWTASVAVAEFAEDETKDDAIGVDQFTITGFGGINTTNGATVDDVELKSTSSAIGFTPATDPAVSEAVAIASAADGGGAGTFDWNIDTALNVPAGQLAGNYSSTVTLTTADGPTSVNPA